MIYDITRPLTPATAVWPGDTPVSHQWVQRIAAGDAVNVSAITLSTHAGTHADAPYHYADSGARLADVPLDVHIGQATLIDVDTDGEILPSHLADVDLAQVERLLVRTRASARPDNLWHDDFAYLSVAAAELLGACGVRLFGTDAPSVDPMQSKTMDAHRTLLRGGVYILESLQLRDVPPGEYELIALPLKIALDASPVRAILRGAQCVVRGA